jgi:hypothetical protein
MDQAKVSAPRAPESFTRDSAHPLKHIAPMRTCFFEVLPGGKSDEAFRRIAGLGGRSIGTGNGVWGAVGRKDDQKSGS